jgi:hypothetical protein
VGVANKRKRGPSPGKAGKKRVDLLFDLADYRAVEKAAEAESLPLATWIRMVALREARKS